MSPARLIGSWTAAAGFIEGKKTGAYTRGPAARKGEEVSAGEQRQAQVWLGSPAASVTMIIPCMMGWILH